MQNPMLLDGQKFQITIQRLCRQLIENHDDFSNSVLIGIQPRGIYLAKRIAEELRKILPDKTILQGDLDITFYRDDFRRRGITAGTQSNQDRFYYRRQKSDHDG